MSDEQPIEFPQYQPPNPTGIPIAHPKQVSTLRKIMNQMTKPRTKMRVAKTRVRTWKKKLSYH